MAAAEEPPDHFGADFARSAGKVLGPEPGGKGYLQASPDIGYVRVLEPGPSLQGPSVRGRSTRLQTAGRTAASAHSAGAGPVR